MPGLITGGTTGKNLSTERENTFSMFLVYRPQPAYIPTHRGSSRDAERRTDRTGPMNPNPKDSWSWTELTARQIREGLL